MSGKKAILDASSAIILCKAKLQHLLIEVYEIVLAESVYHEVTAKPYSGAEEYRQLVTDKKIRVEGNLPQNQDKGIGLDQGEYDTIQLYYQGVGDFVITDDGAAARYCKREGVPFINALLFPVVLRYEHIAELGFCDAAFEDICETGRYTENIISFAGNCRKEDVLFALPTK